MFIQNEDQSLYNKTDIERLKQELKAVDDRIKKLHRVKIFVFTNKSGSFMTDSVNEWIANEPGILIHDIQLQSSVGTSKDKSVGCSTVLIWYQEG